MRCPSIFNAGPLFRRGLTEVQVGHDWVLARPPAPRHGGTLPARLRAAWLVLAGRADALVWPAGQ